MTQILNTFPHEVTLGRLELQTSFLKSFQDKTNILKMFCKCLREDQDVININFSKISSIVCLQITQNFLHQPLEHRRGVSKSKQRDTKFEQAMMGDKCRFLSGRLVNLNLPVSGR